MRATHLGPQPLLRAAQVGRDVAAGHERRALSGKERRARGEDGRLDVAAVHAQEARHALDRRERAAIDGLARAVEADALDEGAHDALEHDAAARGEELLAEEGQAHVPERERAGRRAHEGRVQVEEDGAEEGHLRAVVRPRLLDQVEVRPGALRRLVDRGNDVRDVRAALGSERGVECRALALRHNVRDDRVELLK